MTPKAAERAGRNNEEIVERAMSTSEDRVITSARKASELAGSRPVTEGWKRYPANNDVLECDGFLVSYQPKDLLREYDRLMGHAPSSMDSANPETALIVKGERNRYLILRGDHREAYERLAPSGLEACLAYFRDNAGQTHFFSDSLPENDEPPQPDIDARIKDSKLEL